MVTTCYKRQSGQNRFSASSLSMRFQSRLTSASCSCSSWFSSSTLSFFSCSSTVHCHLILSGSHTRFLFFNNAGKSRHLTTHNSAISDACNVFAASWLQKTPLTEIPAVGSSIASAAESDTGKTRCRWHGLCGRVGWLEFNNAFNTI